jgi:hypothetical protein
MDMNQGRCNREGPDHVSLCLSEVVLVQVVDPYAMYVYFRVLSVKLPAG